MGLLRRGEGGEGMEMGALLRELEELREAKAQLTREVSRLKDQAHAHAREDQRGGGEREKETARECVEVGSSVGCPLVQGWISSGGGIPTMSADAISRYSRQLLVPAFGVQGQKRLLESSILVVGAGGLGSPVALYLAAAGVGCLGLVDHDIVELNNLHRQVIHTEAAVGSPKVKSASAACRKINSSLKVVEHFEALAASNAIAIFQQYDIVVDATDNVPTRYLINDSCVALQKPLVSGAALGLEGQITVYNYKGGPCYRCLFPVPPPQGACQRCADSGVLGVVPGIIGCFQALEAIKIASEVGEPLNGRMLIFDALTTTIRIVKLRSGSSECVACGTNPNVTKENIHIFDYEAFTQFTFSTKSTEGLKLIPASQRITSQEYSQYLKESRPHLLLDVRQPHQYEISALPNSMNVPLRTLKDKLKVVEEAAGKNPIIVVCRRGNDSQRAVEVLQTLGRSEAVDIIGGLESWVNNVDPNFPIY